MKQLPKDIRSQLVRALEEGADLCSRYWAEGLGVEMQTATKQIEGGQFKGDRSEIQDLMELLNAYHEFLLEKEHKFLAKDIRQLQSTVTEALEEEEAR
jgi:ubiquinone biosynthesis protein UbiJ